MAIDFSRADIDGEIGTIDGVADVDAARLITHKWNDPRAGSLGYWRLPDDRMPRGRISLLQYGRNASDRLDREIEQLRKYGAYKSNDRPGSWQPWKDPFLALVQRNGLPEFDAQQLVDLGWHRRPGRNAYQSHREIWRKVDELIERGMDEIDARNRVMPQLIEHDVADVSCELCPGKTFSGLSPRVATALKHRHDSIVHKEEVRSRETRDAIAQAVSESGGQNADLMAVIAEAIKMLAANQGSEAKRGPGRPPKAAESSE